MTRSISVLKQKKHFDQPEHQFSKEKTIFPSPAQKIEIDRIYKNLDLPASRHLLDFGCGTGRMTIPFLAKGYQVDAYDISRNSRTILRSTYLKYRKKTWGQLKIITKMPAKSKYDAIIGSDILHHVSLPKVLPVLYQALKPNSVLVMSEPNAWHIPWYLFFFAKRIWSIERGLLQCSQGNLSKEFKNAGFTSITLEGHGLLPTLLLNPFPLSIARFAAVTLANIPFVKNFAFRFIIIARK